MKVRVTMNKPWLNLGRIGHGILVGSKEGYIAVFYGPNENPHCDHHVRLALAAQDMLSAMEKALPYVEFYSKREIQSPSNGEEAVRATREMLHEFRAAIEKARRGVS